MSTLSQFSGGGIKGSVQRGTITIGGNFPTSETSKTQTISAVDTSKSIINYLGNSVSGADDVTMIARLSLTNSTTITATRARSDYTSTIVSYEVIEFY